MLSRFSAFPNEIYIMIINEVFNSQSPSPSVRYDVDNSLHLVLRAQRVQLFRILATVCKAWFYPVRTAFWKEVTLFTVHELIALARTFEGTTQPDCIRGLYLRFFSLEGYFSAAEEVKRSLLVILRRLSPHLDVLHFSCGTRHSLCSEILYRSLRDASQDRSLSIDVTKLDIQSPRVFRAITFVRNVVHLVLAVDCCPHELTPIPSMQLESLVLQINFSGPGIATAVEAVTIMLGPASQTLQSLTLDLYGYDALSEAVFPEAMKYVLSLKGPSTSVLNLCAKPFYPLPMAQELANAHVIPAFPALQYLHLDEIGVSPDIFFQLCCYGLRQLRVTVTETETPSARDWVETMNAILASIQLNELGNLEDLVVDFSSVTGYDEDAALRATVGRWMDKEPAWEPLETACAVRGIACAIRHPH